jgi:hypothetical protein
MREELKKALAAAPANPFSQGHVEALEESNSASRIPIASLVAHVMEDCVILQNRAYIEDGWFIKVIPSQVQLWEIPQFGGEESLIATFPSITEAYKHAITLA